MTLDEIVQANGQDVRALFYDVLRAEVEFPNQHEKLNFLGSRMRDIPILRKGIDVFGDKRISMGRIARGKVGAQELQELKMDLAKVNR